MSSAVSDLWKRPRFEGGEAMLMQEVVEGLPIIRAERFVLRPLRKSDAGLIAMYTGDKRVAVGTSSIPHPLPPGATEAFIERSTSAGRLADVWVMDGSANDMSEVLGIVSLKPMDRGQSEIGYWVAPVYWNAGIASEAVRALLAANPQGLRTVFAAVMQDNPGSARVLTNAGFEYLGDAETFSVARNACVPTWTYLKKLG
jgi:RimJ/RimL family protein N-acetyltransferase